MKINENNIIAREAQTYILTCFILIIVFAVIGWEALSVIFLALLAFVMFFFRNPLRKVIQDPAKAYSPADGKIMSVEKVTETRFLEGAECWKITIFLSIFNVHFNRTPVEGTVEKVQYVEGKFFPAFKSHAGTDNERNYVLLSTAKGPVIMAQITGFVARRIVCYVTAGESLNQGERFGLIKFGSCTELYLPLDYEITVKAGDKVKGGLSVIGVI